MTTQLPSIAQMVNRVNTGHRKALRAYRDDTKAVSPYPSPGEIRGMRAILRTLRRWECVEGDALTERGRVLLDQLEAEKVPGRIR